MEIILVILVFILFPVIKHSVEDSKQRDNARKQGHNIYASRSGLRYTDTNEKYLGSKRWYQENIIDEDKKNGLR